MFVDTANGDYHLLADSRLIDAGHPDRSRRQYRGGDAGSAGAAGHIFSRYDRVVGDRQGTAGDEGFLGGRVAGTLGFHMYGMDFTPAPVEDEKCVLVFGWEFCAIAEGGAGG